MKRNLTTAITTFAFLTLLTIPIRPSAQELSLMHMKRPRYKLIDLGTFGGPNSTDFASPIINNKGEITGGADTADLDPNAPNCYNPDCFVTHAYLWRRGALVDLNALPGGFGSAGNWINDHGQIAGESLNGLMDPLMGTPAKVGVFWKHDGEIIDLGTFGGNESLAATINNKRQIVGAAANSIPDPLPGPLGVWGTQTRAFLWKKGLMTDLGDLGGPDAFAIFVNDHSQIAGVSYTGYTPNLDTGIPTQEPFLWEHGKMLGLGTLGGTVGETSGLNNRGQVAGSSDLEGDFTRHPFLWSRGRLKDLGTLGGTFGFLTSLNDAGQVVGAATTAGDEALHAFFWTKA